MVIVGAKGFAKEIFQDIFDSEKHQSIVFFDNVNKIFNEELFGKKVLTNLKETKKYFSLNSKEFVLGVGDPRIREKLFNLFVQIGGLAFTSVSKNAQIGNFENSIGEGCAIMSGTTITNSISIGKGCLINLHCTIGHDVTIGDFVELSPGVHISGNSSIGSFCSLGTNSAVLPKVSIGNNVIIGAGAVVTKDIPDNSLAIGVPAKVIRKLDEFNSPLS